MNEEMFQYRAADLNDAAGILAALREVAPEIPVLLDTPDRLEVMNAIIAECCNSGESWVATNAAGTVVGFVLAKPDRLERFLHRNEAVSIRYVGVIPAKRKQGIFGVLMKKVSAKKAPLTASVLRTNQSEMAVRLGKIGFVTTGSDAKEVKVKWEP
jgi:hypothetical protein